MAEGVTLAEAIVFFRGDGKQLLSDLDNAEKKTTSAVGNMAKMFTGALVAGVAVAGAAIVGIGKTAFDVATDLDSATDQIGASLGLGADEAKAYGEAIKSVYGDNFGDSITDVGAAVEIVAKNLKVAADDPALSKLTSNAFRLRDVFGVEVKESIGAVKALVDNFGISAEEAFDLLTTGYQQGLDGSEDLLDTIGEYSVQFAEGGATAVEFFSALDTGLQAGVLGTDKAADAFKEFRLRIQDGSTLTADSLASIGLSADEITAKLSDGSLTIVNVWDMVQKAIFLTEDPLARFNAGVGLIGSQFEDLGEKAILGIDITEDWAEGGLSSVDTLDQKYTSLGSVIEGMWRKFQVGIAPAGEAMLGFVNENLPAIEGVVNSVSGAVVTFIGMIPLALAGIQKGWDEDWGHMRSTIDTFTAEVPDQLEVFWAEVQLLFDSEGRQLAADWGLLWGFTLPGFVTGLVNLVIAQLTEFTRAINGILQILYSVVTLDWSGFWNGLGATMLAVANGILNVVEFFFGPELREKLVGAFSWAWQGVVDFWTSTIAPALNTMREALPFGWGGDGSPSDLGIVNPANQRNGEPKSFSTGFDTPEWQRNYAEIYAPGQLESLRNGTVSNNRSINIQPGAITVNEAARPGQTAEELEEAFIRLLESQQ